MTDKDEELLLAYDEGAQSMMSRIAELEAKLAEANKLSEARHEYAKMVDSELADAKAEAEKWSEIDHAEFSRIKKERDALRGYIFDALLIIDGLPNTAKALLEKALKEVEG